MTSKSIGLEEFLALSSEKPSLLFNAPQRVLASILRLGKDSRGRWNFMYRQTNDDRKINNLYGLDSAADEFVTGLQRATQNKEERKKVFIALGPAGSGKNEFVNTLKATYDSYLESEEGAVYKAKIYVSRLLDKNFSEFFESEDKQKEFVQYLKTNAFGEADRIMLSIGNNIQTVLYMFTKHEGGAGKTAVEKMINEINSNVKENWKKVAIDENAESSTVLHVKSVLLDAFEMFAKDPSKKYEFLERAVAIEKGKKGIDTLVASSPAVSSDNKDFESKQVFGGEKDLDMLKKLDAKDSSPLAYKYGIAGGQNLPSPAGGLLELSEMLKGGSGFKNKFLDFIQNRRVDFSSSFTESYDVVAVGSGNLDEIPSLRAELKSYLMSRLSIIAFPYMTRRSDIKKSLEEIYSNAKNELDIHYSPRFLHMLSLLLSEISIEEYPNLSLKTNSELHDGVMRPQSKVSISIEEILRFVNSKPITERKEGITLGLPYRHVSASPSDFRKLAKKVLESRMEKGGKNIPEDHLCLDMVFDDNNTSYLEDFLNTMDDVTTDTAGRIRSKVGTEGSVASTIVQDAFDEYRKMVTSDVSAAFMGDAAISKPIEDYIRQVYYLQKGTEKYVDYDGRLKPVDKDEITHLEVKAGLNSNAIREGVVRTVDSYIQAAYPTGGLTNDMIAKAAQAVMDEYPQLQSAVIERQSAGKTISVVEEEVIRRLEKRGYCTECAKVAINVYKQYSIQVKHVR